MIYVESLSFFISFLYLDLYVIGDDALISKGSFLLDLESKLYTCQTMSSCNIGTHFAKRWLILFVIVMFLHFVSVRSSRRRVVWVSQGERGSYRERLKYM